jgi:flavodoxin
VKKINKGEYMKIIYNSNTGHTERYAKMLADKLHIECIKLKDYKETDEQIIYLGWIFASNIKGYRQIKNNHNIICTIAVGMNQVSDKNNEQLIKTNNITTKFFYLQGGIDYSKLKGINKLIIKMVGKKVAKDNKPEDKKMIEVFKNGGNFINENNIDEIVLFINNFKK